MALAVGLPAGSAAAAGTAANAQYSDRIYPGVQLIEADYSANLSIPDPALNESAMKSLETRLASQALTGVIGSDTSSITQAAVDAISKDIFTYFTPGSTKSSEPAELSGFGTGWVATSDGYIVTAAHVVKPDQKEITTAFAEQALTQFSQQAVKELQTGDTKFTADQAKELGDALTKWAAKYLTVNDLKSTLSAQLGVAVAGFKKSQKGRPVQIVSVGESYPGKDIAILKLDGEQHLPTLPVGQDADVSAGSTLHVAGYPAASTFYSGLSKDSQVQPSITQGPLTAVKSNEQGTPIFQTQAPASPGNSGGPVLDDDGKVVGVLVASAVNDQGVALEGQEFVIPVSVIWEKLNEKNIHPATSDTSNTYDKALAEYYQKHYKNAVPLFQQASALYPGHPYVGDFLSKSTAAIQAGQDQTPSNTGLYLGLGIAAAAVVVLLLAFVLIRRRKRAGTGGPGGPGAPQQWAPQYPQQPGYPPQPQPQAYPQPYPQQQPGYPPQQPGYPPPQPGYPPPQPGYRPQQPGYPPPQPGYPPR